MSSSTIIIEARRTDRHYWRDLWRYRELLWILCSRDIAVRYKQTVVGIAWALLKPLVAMATFTILLGRVAGLPSEPGVPYSLMVFSGMLIWNFFAQCLTVAGGSMLANANLVSKVYLPRLLIPLSSIVVAVADLLVSLLLFCFFLIWFSFLPPWQCLFLPLLILLGGLLALGPALMLAAWSLPYRDILYITPLIVQLGMYVTPVVYTSSIVPQKWFWLYMLNPMVGVVDGFRWAILGAPEFPAAALLTSCLWTVILLIAGFRIFREMERTFVDVM